MSVADDVHGLALERDKLAADLAASEARLKAIREQEVAYWRRRAEAAEELVATHEAQARLTWLGERQLEPAGCWNIWFQYNDNEGAGMDFKNNPAQFLSGIVQSWIARPGPLQIKITPGKDNA